MSAQPWRITHPYTSPHAPRFSSLARSGTKKATKHFLLGHLGMGAEQIFGGKWE